MTLTDLLPPEDRERQLELFRQARDNTAAEYSVEKRYRRRDGTVLWVQATVGFLRDERGRAYRALAIVQDITPLKRIEQDLRSSEERFRRLVETSTVGLGICDTHGKVFYANQAILTMLGFTAEEVPQVNWIDLTPSEYLPRDLQTIEQLRATGTCTPYEKQLIAQDGRRVPVLLGVSMIDQDDVGDPIGACFVTDLTRLKEAEAERERLLEAQRVALEQLERFRIALDSAADYIFLIDPQTLRFLDVSQSACRALGYSREELLELGPREVMPQISEEEIRRRFAEIRSDPAGKGAIETLHYRKDGSCFEVEKILRPVEVRGRVLLVGVARDITERKQAEAALRAANAQLAEADRRKNEFLAMLAHELRNPLAPIRNAMQVLRLIDLNEPAQKRQGDIIDRQITHMARLVNDLLDVSRITRGKIELSRQPLALADVLPPAVETAMPMIETRHQTLTMSPPSPALRVLADLDRLAQVVGNLLTNAAKYTEEGGRIWLEAGREGGDAVIRVRDTGVGIAQELLPHIFDLFTQAEQSLARSQGGLGIGLTMVRSLVEMHGGSVEVHSAGLGQGSEFTIRLPALAA